MINPRITIVIPCRNEEQYIGRCLQAIVEADYPQDLLEVIVCDGLSEDKTQQIVQEYSLKYPWIQLLLNLHQTTPHALNLGIENASGDLIVIFGAHAEMHTDYLVQCVNSLYAHPDAGGVGGILLNQFENPMSEMIGSAMSSVFGVGDAHFRTGTREGYVDTVVFGAYRKEVFIKAGLFDEELVRNQDDEFNYRLLQNGYKLWLDKSIVSKYYVRSSLKRLFNQYYEYGLWKVYVNKKHRAITTIRQLVPFLFVLLLLVGGIASFFSQWIFFGYLFLIAVYFFLAVVFSLRQVNQFTRVPKLVLIFFVLHASYGFGYLTGVIKFLFLNHGAGRAR